MLDSLKYASTSLSNKSAGGSSSNRGLLEMRSYIESSGAWCSDVEGRRAVFPWYAGVLDPLSLHVHGWFILSALYPAIVRIKKLWLDFPWYLEPSPTAVQPSWLSSSLESRSQDWSKSG